MQYYFGAILLLTIHKPLSQSAGGFEAAKLRCTAEVSKWIPHQVVLDTH